VAPTPTVSDAPMATYLIAPDATGATVGVSVTRASVDAVGCAGAAVVARAGGPPHAVTSSSAARKKLARDKVRIDGA
jgi:hypothetical protein